MTKLNIRQLEAFRATVLAGTVSGASSMVGLSQPSVSRLVNQLESSLGVPLFDRANGRLLVTPEGKVIFDEVEHTFRGLGKIHELAQDLRNAQFGNLAVAAMPALGGCFLPDAIAAFSATHPNVKISLEVLSSSKVEDSVAMQPVDFGLAEIPYGRDGVLVDEFCRAPYYAVMPRDHALGVKPQLCAADFAELPYISMSRSSPSRHSIDRYFGDHKVMRRLLVDTSSLSATCELVRRGVGLSLVDPFNAVDHHEHLCVRKVSPVIEFKVGLFYPGHRPLSKVARTFIAHLRRCRDRWLVRAENIATV